MKKRKHGQLTNGGSTRWCENHNQEHGFLYSCPKYSKEVNDEILEGVNQFRNNLSSERWVKEQNTPKEVIEILKVFAGL